MSRDFCVGYAECLYEMCGKLRAETRNRPYATATHDRCNFDSFGPTSFVDDLLHPRHTSDDCETVSTPLVKGIEMDITDKLEKVGLFLTDNRGEPILKQMTGAPVPAVENYSVSCHQATHTSREAFRAAS